MFYCCYCVFAHLYDFNLEAKKKFRFFQNQTWLCLREVNQYVPSRYQLNLEIEDKVSCISTEGQVGVSAYFF